MNTQPNNLFKAISHTETKQLITIADESLFIETDHVKTFTVADLWNIQRQKKTIVRRRYLA